MSGEKSGDYRLVVDLRTNTSVSMGGLPEFDVSPEMVACLVGNMSPWQMHILPGNYGIAYRSGVMGLPSGNGRPAFLNAYFGRRVRRIGHILSPYERQEVDREFERIVLLDSLRLRKQSGAKVIAAILPAPESMSESLDMKLRGYGI